MSPDLEVARGDINRLGELAPVVQIAQNLPIIVAIIDDEQLAAALTRASWHAVT